MLSESEAKATLFENPKRKRSESERISKILSESENFASLRVAFRLKRKSLANLHPWSQSLFQCQIYNFKL